MVRKIFQTFVNCALKHNSVRQKTIITNMPSQQKGLPLKLQKPIENIIDKENFKTYSIDVKNIEQDGSFLGKLREINIRGETESVGKELKLFTKTIPEDGDVNIYSITYTYENETYMYTEFQKVINEVQEEANVPVSERYTLAKSYDSTDFEVIIMENLAGKGYAMYPRKEVVTLKFAELAIKKLAQYHSFAFIIKEKRPKFFEEKIIKMKQPFYYGQKAFNDFVKNFSLISINCLDPIQKAKMLEFLPTTYDKYKKYTEDPTNTWTMVHGDYRHSNVMAKFENNEAQEMIIIDYQHAFYGCSIIDLIYFIVSGTDQEFRKNHMEHLKNFYYESMKEFLKLFGLHVENYYPRVEFEKLYKERLDYGLMVAMWLLPVILANKGEIPDIANIDLTTCDFQLSDLIKKRVRGIVDDYIQWGYI